MKKILAILLAAMLMFGAVACTNNDADDTNTDTTDTNEIVDTNDTADTSSDTEAVVNNDVIEPAATRQMIAAALEMLAGKREVKPAKKHGNMPL